MMSLGSLAFQENSQGLQALSLVDLLSEVRDVLNRSFRDAIWIIAEVNSFNRNNFSGHCYLELVQNEAGKILAKTNATLFAGVANRVIPKFQAVTGSAIQSGMQLMLLVRVVHSPQWGFSLNILDINPDFTLGQHERIKQETIKRLHSDGVWDLNKSFQLPMLLQRIAVISSETAAGLGDFKRQIEQSAVAGLIHLEYFPAIMQGQSTTASVSEALMSVYNRLNEFDAVVIIRGGGSKLDLAAFDEYNLCCYIANFPGPIITGIGHERDESVCDMVANTSLKTPTAVADFLIRRMEQVVLQLFDAEDRLSELLSEKLKEVADHSSLMTRRCNQALLSLEKQAEVQLNGFASYIQEYLRVMMIQQLNRQSKLDDRLTHQLTEVEKSIDISKQVMRLSHHLNITQGKLEQKRHIISEGHKRLERLLIPLEERLSKDLDQFQQLIRLQDPRHIMKRGFLPVLKDGINISKAEGLNKGDTLEIIMLDGSVKTNIQEVLPND